MEQEHTPPGASFSFRLQRPFCDPVQIEKGGKETPIWREYNMFWGILCELSGRGDIRGH